MKSGLLVVVVKVVLLVLSMLILENITRVVVVAMLL
jgi:hypothetical protein